jgi:methyl-accepting chemotaxis protein
VGADIDATKVVSMENSVKWTLILLIALFIIIVVIVSFILAKNITRPLNIVTNRMMETAKMGGDLTQRIKITSTDEIGQLSSAFNQLFETIHIMMKKVKDTTINISNSSAELSAAMEQGTHEINQIASQSVTLSSGIHDVGGLFEKAKEEIDSLSASSQEVAASSEEVDQAAQNMRTSAETVSTVLKGSVASISELAVLTNNANSAISELDEYTKSIGSIINTINGIAKNTNLLALNAMIEAQRAGEAGRGFAVVAENIRVLSANTQNSVEEIRNLVNAVISRINQIVETQKSIDPAVKKTIDASESANDLLQQIVVQSESVARLISQISDTNGTQADGVQKISTFIYEINNHFSSQVETSLTTTAATQELTATSEMILENANALEKISQELKLLINNFKL